MPVSVVACSLFVNRLQPFYKYKRIVIRQPIEQRIAIMSCVCVCKPLAKDRRRLGGSSCVGSKSVPASSPTDMNHRTRGRGACSPAAVPAGPRPRRPWFQFQSVRLCRSLPSFAFHLASPVICRRRASRLERGGSMQFQHGAARATVRACRVRRPIHRTLAHSDGKPHVQLSSHATRAQSGLCRPIWVPGPAWAADLALACQ
jgi:hypothetical protein